MTQMLKEYDRKFKITMINILKILMVKMDNRQDQMGVFSRVENYKKNKNAKNGKLFNRDEECF